MTFLKRQHLPWVFHFMVGGVAVAYASTSEKFLAAFKDPEPKSVTRSTSDDSVYESSALYKDKFQGKQSEVQELKEEMNRLKTNVPSDVANLREEVEAAPSAAAPGALQPQNPQPAHVSQTNATQAPGGLDAGLGGGAATPLQNVALRSEPPAPEVRRVLTFDTSMVDDDPTVQTVIPVGAYVKARILTGVEAGASGEPPPMLLQADYAFQGPNSHQIDMSGCFIIAMVKGNLSTERVTGQAVKISCVRNSGEAIKRDISGYLVGEDSTFGLTGQLISRQGQVFTAAVIANLAKNIGEAVSIANSKTVISATNGVIEKGTSVDPKDRAAFVGGKSVAGAAEMIAQWYLNQAQSLTPSIAVGSGRDIFIVLLDSVMIPPLEERGEFAQ